MTHSLIETLKQGCDQLREIVSIDREILSYGLNIDPDLDEVKTMIGLWTSLDDILDGEYGDICGDHFNVVVEYMKVVEDFLRLRLVCFEFV